MKESRKFSGIKASCTLFRAKGFLIRVVVSNKKGPMNIRYLKMDIFMRSFEIIFCPLVFICKNIKFYKKLL